jgi:hypothetical protein
MAVESLDNNAAILAMKPAKLFGTFLKRKHNEHRQVPPEKPMERGAFGVSCPHISPRPHYLQSLPQPSRGDGHGQPLAS